MSKLMYSAEEVNQILFEITLDKAKVEEKLQKIKKIVNRPTGFSEEEKAYNYMMQVIDIREVLEQE